MVHHAVSAIRSTSCGTGSQTGDRKVAAGYLVSVAYQGMVKLADQASVVPPGLLRGDLLHAEYNLGHLLHQIHAPVVEQNRSNVNHAIGHEQRAAGLGPISLG